MIDYPTTFYVFGIEDRANLTPLQQLQKCFMRLPILYN